MWLTKALLYFILSYIGSSEDYGKRFGENKKLCQEILPHEGQPASSVTQDTGEPHPLYLALPT